MKAQEPTRAIRCRYPMQLSPIMRSLLSWVLVYTRRDCLILSSHINTTPKNARKPTVFTNESIDCTAFSLCFLNKLCVVSILNQTLQ